MMAAPSGARSPLVRVVTVVLAVIVAFMLVRTIVRHKLSQAFFEQANIATAFAINPHDGIAGGYLAWILENAGRSAIAVPLARHAFAETTLSAPALGALALADPQGDRRLLDFAAAAGWRDPRLQAWLGRVALDRGEAPLAAAHVDAAARIQGVTPEIRALVDRMAATPPLRAAIGARLRLVPPWRMAYFQSIEPPFGDVAARAAILGTLVGTPTPPTALEVGVVAALATRARGLPFGYTAWRSVSGVRVDHFVYDPDFRFATDDPEKPSPFLWRLAPGLGVSSEITTENGRSALHVTGDGGSATSVASEMLRISPGRHRFAVSGRYASPDAASGFRWSLSCWDAQKPTGFVTPVSGSATGSADFAFDAPADGSCPMLRIELATQQAGRPGPIEAWFNDVRIE